MLSIIHAYGDIGITYCLDVDVLSHYKHICILKHT